MQTKIIVDACGNHLGDERLIRKMISEAARVGADYIKFQLFKGRDLNIDWEDYTNARRYYTSIEISDSMITSIIQWCEMDGIKPLFTAFTYERAVHLANRGIREVKIASPDADNELLVNFCLENFDLVIISNGMTTMERSIELQRRGAKVLYCISEYPTEPDDVELVKAMLLNGFSDHTMTTDTALKAIQMGVEYVERHFTLGRFLPGYDHMFSSTPDEIERLVKKRNAKAKAELYKQRWNNPNLEW